jgi:aspartate aminotransferase
MPSLSERAARMPASPIRKLAPLAEAARRRGIHVYHLNIGQPDIRSPAELLEGYRRHELELVPYGHSAGLREYREALGRYYASFGAEVSADQILVTTGGSEAIAFALTAVADPGDQILVFEPFYTNYNGFSVAQGIEVVAVTCRLDDGFALPPLAELEAKIGPRARAIVICNPNNPTGYVYARAELEALARLCRARDLFLISDEVYRELVFDGAQAISVLTLPGIDEQAIVVDSISKRYSACGSRVGCLVSRNQQVIDAALRMGQARLCPPTLDQLAALRAMQAPAAYLEGVLREYARRSDAVMEELGRLDGVVAHRPRGAFYTIARLPVDDAEHFCRYLLSDFAHERETVMLAPANGFYATPGLGRDEVRIAFVLEPAQMRRAIQILGLAIAAYAG